MKVTIGKEGLTKTWQANFPEVWPRDHVQFVVDLHTNDCGAGGYWLHDAGGYWLHDCCAVAVYFCRRCLNPTALYNQG